MRRATSILLTKTERLTLRRLLKSKSVRVSLRARIVLLASDGLSNKEIASSVETDEHTVSRWRERFASKRLGGIQHEKPRSGRIPSVRNGIEEKIMKLTKQASERNMPWTARTLAKALGVNHMLVYRVWKRHGLTCHHKG